jgi:uncharacterized membrane protein
MKFEESVVIEKPLDIVFSFATDLGNNHLWQTDVLEVEQTSDGPIGLGATYRCVNTFMGKRIETEGRVALFEPESKCTFQFLSGPVTGQSSYVFERIAGGTKFTATGEINLNVLSIGKWIVNHFVKEQIRNDLKKLKHILENGYHKATG